MNTNNFTIQESDIDYNLSTRVIQGRITKWRYKIIEGFCRRHTKRYKRCYHDYDCCGCCYGCSVTPTWEKGKVTITLIFMYNY